MQKVNGKVAAEIPKVWSHLIEMVLLTYNWTLSHLNSFWVAFFSSYHIDEGVSYRWRLFILSQYLHILHHIIELDVASLSALVTQLKEWRLLRCQPQLLPRQ